MSYNKYPKEMKDSVVSRILSGEESLSDIHRDTGININTLYRWRDEAQRSGLSATTKYKNADNIIISTTSKFRSWKTILGGLTCANIIKNKPMVFKKSISPFRLSFVFIISIPFF